ncbi:MAG: universal stress protein [Candidatus Scalindua sp.]|jgi:nucleotide-binding universal stress UspA family protein|nr:universal stress protein [Candidatus Scalindua sp.]MBT5305560.1 universal stress protein [Candidatus Scalindua sp.]MBT6045905.1 universal stress protein [Candidatus Scalindua sp.]MBT6228982.1 universal stress protein [Candidatus Scalindua sp.]MBT6565123.1 universal stress protein [Candidatus Scalindua sp.]
MNDLNNNSNFDNESLNTVFHPSDFSKASEIAFAHALKLTIAANANLELFHVTQDSHSSNVDHFPSVRRTLEQWKVLPAGSTSSQVADLGISIKKKIVSSSDTVRSVLHQLEKNHSDLIVLATHQRDGISHILHKAVAEPVSRQSEIMTLFVPHGTEGFVSLKDGNINLRNILIPIAHNPDPQLAVDTASTLMNILEPEEPTFTLLHVGDESNLPKAKTYTKKNLTWKTVITKGNIVDQILSMEKEHSTDLIVMTTQGHVGLMDNFRGSTTEKILRNSNCPVLAVPVKQ